MRFKVGAGVPPQHTSYADLRDTWLRVEDVGADSLWTWDHFYPLYGPKDGEHFECYSLLAAQAALTSRLQIGALVTCCSYRNPQLLADMARTIDHVSGGRFVLGIGSGWFERDYTEFGYEFGTVKTRLAAFGEALPLIRSRLAKLNPGPVNGHLPILIAGGGEQVMLRLVAEHADMWHVFADTEGLKRKGDLLTGYLDDAGRPADAIERTVNIDSDETLAGIDGLVALGFSHFFCRTESGDPDLKMLRKVIAWRDAQG